MSLPDTYQSSRHMARVLTSYIDCPHRVRREIVTMFPSTPLCVETIRKIRAGHLARRTTAPDKPSFKPHEGHYPAEVSRLAEDANARFVERLRQARRAA